jgi:REP element-mobilizing transposase RayT
VRVVLLFSRVRFLECIQKRHIRRILDHRPELIRDGFKKVFTFIIVSDAHVSLKEAYFKRILFRFVIRYDNKRALNMRSQLSLLKEKKYASRKVARPISTKEFNHIVVKSSLPILRRQYRLIQLVLIEAQKRFGIELRAFAVMPDHVHLVVKVSSRKQFADALRFFTGQVALKMGRGKIWAERAWSRVVRWGRDYAGVVQYVWNNPIKGRVFDLRIDAVWILNGILFGDLPDAIGTLELDAQSCFEL